MVPDSLLVSELFHSIQGESTWAGLPCVFVRLAGCNLRCAWCDAAYTRDEAGKLYTIDELLEYAGRYPTSLLEVTGGEPLLQEAVYPLLDRLLAAGRSVLLETNGSLDIGRVPAGVIRIVDIKCPDSGMEESFLWKNLDYLSGRDEIKFVLASRRDFEWATEVVRRYGLLKRFPVLFSAVPERLPPSKLAGWLLQEDQLPVRLQIQLHKILWPHISRGV